MAGTVGAVNLGIYRERTFERRTTVNISAGGTITLDVEQARCGIIELTGAVTAATTVIFPADDGLHWSVNNLTSQAQGVAISLSTTGGVAVTLPVAGNILVYADGTSLQQASASGAILISQTWTNANFPTASSSFPDLAPVHISLKHLADTTNIQNPFNLIYTGFGSNIQMGDATHSVGGTLQNFTCTMDVQNAGSPNNETANYMGWARAKAADGQNAHAISSLWFTDFSLHGNIGSQSNLLNGITMLINSYASGTPARGAAAGMWLVTKPGQGAGAEDGHNTAPTFMLDYMLGIFGYAGSVDQTTKDRGASRAISIGGFGSGWCTGADNGKSWFMDGISLRGCEVTAIRIKDPHYDPSNLPVGSGILYDAADATKHWNWLFDADSLAPPDPLVGAILLSRTNAQVAGQIAWGTGGTAPSIWRSANNQITATGKFVATVGLGAGNSAAKTTLATPGTVTKMLEVFDASGASLGAVPIYSLGAFS